MHYRIRNPRPKYKVALKPKHREALRKSGYIPKLFRIIAEDFESYTFEEIISAKKVVIRI